MSILFILAVYIQDSKHTALSCYGSCFSHYFRNERGLSQTVWLCVLTGFLAAFIRLVSVVQLVLPGFREIIGF